MIEEKRDRGEQPEEQVNIQEILFRYLIHWPWFPLALVCDFYNNLYRLRMGLPASGHSCL